MSVTRFVASITLAICFGTVLAKIVKLDMGAIQASAMTLCESGGRRPCP